MKVDELVYIYMFDLDVTLMKTNSLAKHRFGKIKAINKVDLYNSKDKALKYEIELNRGDEVSVTTYDPMWNVITLEELEEKVNKVVEIKEIKELMLEQIHNFKEQA